MKQLISAETIRQEHAAGTRRLEVILPHTIVTGEARTLAEKLGIQLVESLATIGNSSPVASAICPAPAATAGGGAPLPAEIAEIRAAIVARLPEGCVSDAVVDQLIRKALDEQQGEADASRHAGDGSPGFKAQLIGRGIKLVQGNSVRFGRFDGAGSGNQVGLADVVTAGDRSPMAAGYMTWCDCFFPWTLSYDEIDVVLEGELHIRSEGCTAIGRPGDVIFIPRGSAIEFGTPTSVRFLYVTYPADWQDQ